MSVYLTTKWVCDWFRLEVKGDLEEVNEEW